MKLDEEHEPDYDDDSDVDEDYALPRQPWRLTRHTRDTILFCMAVGIIASLVWGIYRWTNASRYTPPIYSGSTTLPQ